MNTMTKLAITSGLLLATALVATPSEARGRRRQAREAIPAAAPAPVAAAPAAPAAPPPAAPPARDVAAESDDEDDDGPPPDGFSFGARVGYAIPMGSIAKDSDLGGATDLSKTAAGMVPLWVDAGYRIDPHWYVGGYFQLGIVSTSGDVCRRVAGTGSCSSSGTDLRFGAMAKYTFKPDGKVSPWVGLSTGYEILNLAVTVGANSADMSTKGWEFAGAHVGADFHPARAFTIGPMFSASFGQYASQSWSRPNGSGSSDFNNTALHQWVMFGVRGQFDL